MLRWLLLLLRANAALYASDACSRWGTKGESGGERVPEETLRLRAWRGVCVTEAERRRWLRLRNAATLVVLSLTRGLDVSGSAQRHAKGRRARSARESASGHKTSS